MPWEIHVEGAGPVHERIVEFGKLDIYLMRNVVKSVSTSLENVLEVFLMRYI